MSEKVFPYKPRFRVASMGYGVIAPLFLIIFPIVYPFSITIGGFTIVPYPWTILLFVLAALGFAWSFYDKVRQYLKLKDHDCSIHIDGRMVKYVDVVKGKPTEITFSLDHVHKIKMDDEEGELDVTVTDTDGIDRILTYDIRYFRSQEDLDEFVRILGS